MLKFMLKHIIKSETPLPAMVVSSLSLLVTWFNFGVVVFTMEIFVLPDDQFILGAFLTGFIWGGIMIVLMQGVLTSIYDTADTQ